MRPLDYIRKKLHLDKPASKQSLSPQETDYLASIHRDSLVAGQEVLATNWSDVGSPIPPSKLHLGSNSGNFSNPVDSASGRMPTAPPGYPDVNVTSTRLPSVPPNPPHNVTRAYIPNSEVVDSERVTLPPKPSFTPDLTGDFQAAEESLKRQGFDTLEPPIKPSKLYAPRIDNFLDSKLSPTKPIPGAIRSSPLTPQQKMEAELNQLRLEEREWDILGDPIPPRFPITNDET